MKKIILAAVLLITIIGCSNNSEVSWEECCSIQKSTLSKVSEFGDSILDLSYKNSDFAAKSAELNEIIAQIKREVNLDLVEKEVLLSLSSLEQASEQISKLEETSSQNEFAVEIDNISSNYEEAENMLMRNN